MNLRPASAGRPDAAPLLGRAAILAAVAIAAGACQANDTFVPADGQPALPTCVPNLDGAIGADELPVAWGAEVRFRVTAANKTAEVSTRGSDDGSGARVWLWDAATADDDVVAVGPQKLSAFWFADYFPDAQFVLPIDRDGMTYGAYRRDDQAVWLLGFASKTQQPASQRTLARYSTPIAVTRFPLAVGQQFQSAAKLSGAEVNGLPFAGEHRYTVTVDGAGELQLPDLSFAPALRVRTVVDNQPFVGAAVRQHQVSIFFECFGEVARLRADGQERADGVSVGELWRYHP